MSNHTPFPVSTDSLPALRELELRDYWQGRMKSKGYAALVRTPDYSTALPIVRLSDRRFAISLPQRFRSHFRRTTNKSLGEVIAHARGMILQAAVLAGQSALVLVDYPSDAPSRTRNLLAHQPESSVSDRRFINPKEMLGTGSDWFYAPVPVWLMRMGATPAERLVYAWMIFRADRDGVFRRSHRSIHNEMQLAKSTVEQALRSLLNRRLIYIHPTSNAAEGNSAASTRIRPTRFLWHPAMEHSNELPSGQPELALTAPPAGAVRPRQPGESAPPAGAVLPRRPGGTAPSAGEHKEENQTSESLYGATSAADNDDDSGGATIEELERTAKEAGANIERERQTWKTRSRVKGWSEDKTGWRRWLVCLIKRKPMRKTAAPPAAPTPALIASDGDRARIAAGLKAFRERLTHG